MNLICVKMNLYETRCGRRLVLTLRHKTARKWPIAVHNVILKYEIYIFLFYFLTLKGFQISILQYFASSVLVSS